MSGVLSVKFKPKRGFTGDFSPKLSILDLTEGEGPLSDRVPVDLVWCRVLPFGPFTKDGSL